MNDISEKNFINDFILHKIKKYLEEKNITTTLFGNILGGEITESKQDSFQRGTRFLQQKTKITAEKLVLIASFLEISVSDFFPKNITTPYALNSDIKNSKNQTKNLSEIEKNLREMGFDEDIIKNQIRQLQALEVYIQHDKKNLKNKKDSKKSDKK